MSIWYPEEEPAPVRIGPLGWVRAVIRCVLLFLVVFGGLALKLLLRLIERPIWGLRRPITPFITQIVCKISLFIIGLQIKVKGDCMTQNGAIVSNHSSWLDIFVLNSVMRMYFVAKSEVSGWPLVGWLARATGTVFIARRATDAKTHLQIFEKRLLAGHKLLFFPEGTSTDGLRVLAFKSTLFQAYFQPDLRDQLYIQPVTVKYHAPEGQEPRFYGWWGDMQLAPHLIKVLAMRRQGAVQLSFHPPVAVADFADRKALAQHCQQMVASAM
ncbi:MAG: 1-acyl-sn-glycerol-3-phosphate acyltransferase [Rhodobacterales bacterium]|nr:MAG: 1-acyl-sn-glycerol-3-phosphate acyltransferase [Rhodobacterales bacterium]